MRKQYHPQPSADGLRVWDVDRLVALARTLPVEHVPLSEIWELDEVELPRFRGQLNAFEPRAFLVSFFIRWLHP